MTENAVQQILDRQAITDGLHWYTRWVDLNRVDKQVEIFAEDGKICFSGDTWTEGRENIRALIAPLVAAYEATHHYISNIEMTFDNADEARSMCYLHAWHRPGDGSEDFILFAQYHDLWARTDEGWRIRERRLKTAGTIGRQGPALDGIGRAD